MNLFFTRIHTKTKHPEYQALPIFTRIHQPHNRVYLPIFCGVLFLDQFRLQRPCHSHSLPARSYRSQFTPLLDVVFIHGDVVHHTADCINRNCHRNRPGGNKLHGLLVPPVFQKKTLVFICNTGVFS